MKKFKKILKIVGNVFIWVFVAFSVVVTVLAFAAQSNADGIPSVGGKAFLSVLSDSMEPTFNKGDLIIGEMLSSTEKQNLQVGDVITFFADLDGNGKNEINSHRIVDIRYDADGAVSSYVTKGDNPRTNMVEDADPVRWQYVICKWSGSRVGGLGSFLAFLQTSSGFLVLIVIPLLLFFLYEAYQFIMAVVKNKNSGKKQITAADEELIKQRAIEEYIRQQKEAEAAKAAETEPAKEDTPADGE